MVGLAQVGTVCDTSGSAVSLVEDRGSFSVIFAATHELGHGYVLLAVVF